MSDGYRADLAFVHDVGFGAWGEEAAAKVVERGDTVTRTITTFRRIASDEAAGWRRDTEVHTLRLFSVDEVRAALEGAGFTVERAPKVLAGAPVPGITVYRARR